MRAELGEPTQSAKVKLMQEVSADRFHYCRARPFVGGAACSEARGIYSIDLVTRVAMAIVDRPHASWHAYWLVGKADM